MRHYLARYAGLLFVIVIALACGTGDQPSPTPSPTLIKSPAATATRANQVTYQRSTPGPPRETPLAGRGTTLLIVNGTLIDGAGAEPVPNAYVLVKDGRIVATGTGVPMPSLEAEVIDARGGTVMPGLSDSHTHITRQFVGGAAGSGIGINPDGLKPFLEGGITSLRDVGTAPIAFPSSKTFVDTLIVTGMGPRVVWAGPMVTTLGGYPVPVPRYALVAREVESVDEARDVVNQLADGGAGVIKLGLEKGYEADLGWPLLSLKEVKAISETAHQRELRVTAHVTSLDEVRLAIDGGVDDLAHTPTERIPDEMMREMLDKGMGMATTATIWNPGFAEAAAENAARFAALGGTVAIATDFGCCGQPAGSFAWLREIEFLRAAGMTPMQLLIAATRGGAVLAGVEAEVGTIEAGKVADIIVVDGDPLMDIGALRAISVVIQGGKVVKGTSLR